MSCSWRVVVALAVDLARFITVYMVATDIRTTAITIITTTTIQTIPTVRIDPITGRYDRRLYLHSDREAAWAVPPECRGAVVAVWVEVAVAVARFGLPHDIL